MCSQLERRESTWDISASYSWGLSFKSRPKYQIFWPHPPRYLLKLIATIFSYTFSNSLLNMSTLHESLPPPWLNSPRLATASSLSRFHFQIQDTPQSVALPWMSDQPDAETSTWQHTTLTTDRLPCPRRDSNPQFQQTSCSRPTH